MPLKSSGDARGHTPLACCHFKIFKFCGMVPTLCTPNLKYVILFKCTVVPIDYLFTTPYTGTTVVQYSVHATGYRTTCGIVRSLLLENFLFEIGRL
jgi:hypothetical protein